MEQLRARARLTTRLYRAQVKRCAQFNSAEEYTLAVKLRAYPRKIEGQCRLRALQLRPRGRVAPGAWPPPERVEGGSVLHLPPGRRTRDE